MKLRIFFLLGSLIISLLLTTCRDQTVTIIPERATDYSSISTIVFSKHVLPILANNCLSSGCHNSTNAASGLVLDSWESIFSGSRSGAMVVSGNSFMSHLMQVINNDTTLSPVSFPQMPLSRNPLPQDQILFLKRWIDEGAKNDLGEVPFAHPKKGKVFVTNQSADLVAVIDIETNLVMRYVTTGTQPRGSIPAAPHHVRIDQQGIYFYVTLINDQELWKFSATTYEFIAKVSVTPSPADIILTPSGDTAIVTHFSTLPQIATLVDTRTMQVIKTFTVPTPLRPFVSFAHGALLSGDGKRLYTTNQGTGNLTEITLIDNSMRIVALDTSGAPTSDTKPYLADESPDGRYIFVACYGTDDVRVIDRQRDSTRATRIIPVGTRPLHVHVSDDGEYVLAANQGSDDVTIIRTSDYSTTTIPDVGRQPHGVDLSPDGRFLYVTCENQTDAIPPHHPTIGSRGISFVTVIDFASRRIIRRIEVGGFAAGISISKPNP